MAKMAKVYATVIHNMKDGARDISMMSAQSLPKLRADIVWRMEHPKRYFPGLNPDKLSFYVHGRNSGYVTRKNGKIVWINDRSGTYHKINPDGTIGRAYTGINWYD